MKVTVLSCPSRENGGVFFASCSLATALQKDGVEQTVIGERLPGYEQDRSSWGSIPVKTYRPYGPTRFSFKTRSLIRLSNPDLIHSHSNWTDPQWAGLQWQKKTGRPLVATCHGTLDVWALKNSSWKKALVARLFSREALQTATCLHALCDSEAASMRAYGLKNPIVVIPNGVDVPKLGTRNLKLDHQRPLRSAATNDLTNSETQNSPKKLLFLGRIHPKKGLSELISAWSKVQSLLPNALSWELIIAGWDDGGHEACLRQQVNELGLGQSITFTGPVFGAEKEALLQKADAFVLPSFSEGLPVSVLEAWAYQLPVLMTEFCNIPAGFKTGAALRIEPTPDSIANGLVKLFSMADPERENIGMTGRCLVEEQFNWPHIADSMKSVYEWCLGGDRPEHLFYDERVRGI